MRATEQKLIYALSLYIVNNYPIPKNKPIYHVEAVDGKFEVLQRPFRRFAFRSVINRFIFCLVVVIYFIMQSLLEKKKKKKNAEQKLTSQREKLPSAIVLCQQPAGIITHALSNDLSTR